MGCLGNSKTEDQRIDEKAQREANKKIEKQLQKERLAYKATHRLLLLGKEGGLLGGRRMRVQWCNSVSYGQHKIEKSCGLGAVQYEMVGNACWCLFEQRVQNAEIILEVCMNGSVLPVFMLPEVYISHVFFSLLFFRGW